MAGLEDLYREIILDHYRNPRNRGELSTPPAHRSEGFNPLCGDEIVLFVDVDEGVVRDVKVGGQGCSISQASASMMTTAVKGKVLPDALRMVEAFKSMMTVHEDHLDDSEPEPAPPIPLGDLEALRGVVKFPSRIKCATLSWNTFLQALDEINAGEPSDAN